MFQLLASVLTTWYQVFHRILDLKHGLDFYPGLCFYGENQNLKLKIKNWRPSSHVSRLTSHHSPLTTHHSPFTTHLSFQFPFAGVITMFLYSIAPWSPCSIIGPGSPSLLSNAPPVIPGISWLQMIVLPFATTLTSLPTSVMS
jgi:hypothetical protein